MVLGLKTGNAEEQVDAKYAVEWTNDARWLQANGMVDGEVDYLIKTKKENNARTLYLWNNKDNK